MIINQEEYVRRTLGCWMGKNIGGTLGAPFEWRRQINDVSFYTQDLGGEPLPNDDLDIQLLWLVALEEQGVSIDSHLLAEYWVLYVTPHWCEYGTAKVNMRYGLKPPLSGSRYNVYKDSCGAFIRSEIWACIAPGCPSLAARYAYEDAILDHGNGEGTYAEIFIAAMESAAFVLKDIGELIHIGLSYIPSECGVAQAVRDVMHSHQSGKTWKEARDSVLSGFRSSPSHGDPFNASPEDREKGFDDGPLGWDAPANIALTILGLLYGEGDFGQTICIAVNCGEDTDCTAATAGAIFGIVHGVDAIPARWIEPIGRKIKTGCLNLGELGFYGNQLPADVDDLTRRTLNVARQAITHFKLPVDISADQDTCLEDLVPESLYAREERKVVYENANGPMYWLSDSPLERLYENLNATVFRFDFFDVAVDYGSGPGVRSGVGKTIRLRIRNKYKVQENLNIHWYAPEHWKVSPAATGTLFVPHAWLGNKREIKFELQSDEVREAFIRFVVEITIPGRPTVMLVPVTLVQESDLFQAAGFTDSTHIQ